MKIKIILSILFLFISMIAIIVFYINTNRIRMNLLENLRSVYLVTSDNRLYNMDFIDDKYEYILIVYFHPECDFCNIEINDLLENESDLKMLQILFVSYASIEEIKQFILMNPICISENITIVSDIKGEFANAYNIKSPPTNFIYDKNKKLVKIHKGMMSFKQLKKYLKYSFKN